MLVVIGEILFDIFPEYRRLGGAPFNLACHMHHFGWPVKFLTRVGRDKDGEEIMHILKDAGFDLNDVQIDERKPTGRVMVELDSSGIPGFEIIQDSAYDYMEYTREMNDLPSDKIELIYFGTLMQRSERARKTIQGIISSRNPNTRCLYDVNLRPGCYTASIIEASLEQANIVKLNDHELSEIRDMPGNNPSGSGFIPWLMQK
ncbi:MAG: PfkB family carbohydrate kinase, partial [Thermodesulfobacteriota bacterium]|nr:PfkB family carbohydrate kinase [Thermodesulfobacteriota bacterium]